MVYPEIKIKEKRKSFTMKVKISKKEVEGEVFTSEEVTELKRTVLEEISYELDNLVQMMVEDEELSIEQIEAMENALNKVSVSIENETEEVSETEEKA
jgi:DNA anti-recombination protein RmuC